MLVRRDLTPHVFETAFTFTYGVTVLQGAGGWSNDRSVFFLVRVNQLIVISGLVLSRMVLLYVFFFEW